MVFIPLITNAADSEYVFTGHTEFRYQHIDVHGGTTEVANFETYNTDDIVGTSLDTDIYFDMYEDGDKRAEIEIQSQQKKLEQHRLSWFKRDQIVWEAGQKLDVDFSDVFLKSESYTGFRYNAEYLTRNQESYIQLVHGMIGDVEQKNLKRSNLFGAMLTRNFGQKFKENLMLGKIGEQAVIATQSTWDLHQYATLDLQYGAVDTNEVWVWGNTDSAFRSKFSFERNKTELELEYFRVGANYLEIENVNMENDIDKKSLTATYKFKPTTFITAGKSYYHDGIREFTKEYQTFNDDSNIMFAHMPGTKLGYLYYWSLSKASAHADLVKRSTQVIMNRATYNWDNAVLSLSKMWINIDDPISDFIYRSDMGGIGYDRDLTSKLKFTSSTEMTKISMDVVGTPSFTINRTFSTGLTYAMSNDHELSLDYSWNNSRVDGQVTEEKKVITAVYEKNITEDDTLSFTYNVIKYNNSDKTSEYYSDDVEFAYRHAF